LCRPPDTNPHAEDVPVRHDELPLLEPAAAAASGDSSPHGRDGYILSLNRGNAVLILPRMVHLCLGLAPRRFALGQDGRSHPINELVEPDDLVLDTAASCPMEAISVHDTETGEPMEP
jgi:ferredoxin